MTLQELYAKAEGGNRAAWRIRERLRWSLQTIIDEYEGCDGLDAHQDIARDVLTQLYPKSGWECLNRYCEALALPFIGYCTRYCRETEEYEQERERRFSAGGLRAVGIVTENPRPVG